MPAIRRDTVVAVAVGVVVGVHLVCCRVCLESL
jgi:hypothetical protein